MIHIDEDDYDLCEYSLQLAFGKLVIMTQRLPIGVIIGKENKTIIDEILALQNWKDVLLKIDLVEHLPDDMWILYNEKEAVYSNGA
jgi:hypothetical protein